MALSPCVRQIICTLSLPVLTSVQSIITAAQVSINTQLAAISSQLLVLDIAVAPVNLALNAAQELIDQSKVIGTLIPVGIIEGCTDLGELMVGLDSITAKATASLEDFRQDAIRTLSIRDELVELQTTLNGLAVNFDELQTIINDCMAHRT